MIIVQEVENGFIIGRDSELLIAAILFHSWDGTIDTVLVDKVATDDETKLLRKISYQYSETMDKLMSDKSMARQKKYEVFRNTFNEYNEDPKTLTASEWYFNNRHGTFIKNAYSSSEEAIAEIIKQVKDVSGLSVSVFTTDDVDFMGRAIYSVALDDDSNAEFVFWNSDTWPTDESASWELHIVPDYHPSSPSQGRRSWGPMINGATDALIRATAISMVYSPEESRKKEGSFGTSWNYMKHPCKANGKSFQFTLGGFYQASQELVDETVELILCTLDSHPEGKYVAISGGFYPTYDFPQNISNRTGKPLPCKGNPRGSEKHCMWTYDVLKEEGVLEKAYIPSWFYSENWLEFFKEQEGIFPSF